MSRTRAYVSLVVGALGALVFLALTLLVWRILPPVGARVAETAASVRSSVSGVHGRLVEVDDALVDMDVTLAAFREEHEDDQEAVRAQRRRLREELAPFVLEIRADLQDVRDVALSIDNLLETLDLPFLRTARRAGAARMEAIAERVPGYDGEEAVMSFDLAPARRLVGEARDLVAVWRASLDGLDDDLSGVEGRSPRLAFLLAAALTVLALWSLLGQVCLVRSGIRGFRRDTV